MGGFEQVLKSVVFCRLSLSDKTGYRNATGCKKSHRRPRLGRRFALSAALTAPDILTRLVVSSGVVFLKWLAFILALKKKKKKKKERKVQMYSVSCLPVVNR